MKRSAIKLGLQMMLQLTMVSVAWSQLALEERQGAFLEVCNRGNIATDVYVAVKVEQYDFWDVTSTHLAPGACARVYNDPTEAREAYIAFGFVDSRGEWGAGRINRVPDFGKNVVIREVLFNRDPWPRDVLAKAEKKLCVNRDLNFYRIHGDLETDCATFSSDSSKLDRGKFVPLTAALHFAPMAARLSGGTTGVPISISGGAYYLNVTANAGSRVMTAVAGSKSGKDQTVVDPEAADAEARERGADYVNKRRKEEEAAHAPQVAAEQAKDQAMRKSIADANPQWLTQPVILTGTISRVEDLLAGFTTFFFKESPDGGFIVCVSNQLRGLGGVPEFSGLIGRTVEVRGRVGTPYCRPGGVKGTALGLQITVPTQITVK